MYQSTTAFGTLVQQDSRTFKCLLTYDKVSITKVKSIKLTGGSENGDDFSLGSTMSQYIEVTIPDASDASDKIPDGNEIAFFRAGENAIVVNENLTIPPWAFCIYIPFGRDAGLIVVGIGKVIAAYRMNSTWTYRYDIK